MHIKARTRGDCYKAGYKSYCQLSLNVPFLELYRVFLKSILCIDILRHEKQLKTC